MTIRPDINMPKGKWGSGGWANGWNAALDEVARLNPADPAVSAGALVAESGWAEADRLAAEVERLTAERDAARTDRYEDA